METLWYDCKADKGMYGNPIVIESASDVEVCPVATMKAYIEATAESHEAVPD